MGGRSPATRLHWLRSPSGSTASLEISATQSPQVTVVCGLVVVVLAPCGGRMVGGLVIVGCGSSNMGVGVIVWGGLAVIGSWRVRMWCIWLCNLVFVG